MDLDAKRFQEPPESFRREEVEIHSELRKVFKQAGILLGLRRRGGDVFSKPCLNVGELQPQRCHLLLDALKELTAGVTGAPQGDREVRHIAVKLSQLLAEGSLGFEVFITDEVVCGGQAGLR